MNRARLPLEDWPLWARAVTALLILVAVFLLLWIIYHAVGDDQATAQGLPATKWDAQMQALDRQALDRAYVEQMSKVWLIWLQDGGGTTDRAAKGFRNARRAYAQAGDEIERRDAEIAKRSPR
jgi:hypothetical protein